MRQLRCCRIYRRQLFAGLLLLVVFFSVRKFLTSSQRKVPQIAPSTKTNVSPLRRHDPNTSCEKAAPVPFECSLENFVMRLGENNVDLKQLVRPLFSSSYSHNAERTLRQNQLTVWSADLPIGPAADARHMFEAFGAHWISRAGEAFCPESRSALRALDHSPWEPPSHEAIATISRKLGNDAELQRSDAVFVSLPAPANVEFFARLNKSLIIVLATRYEEGRYETARWTELNSLLFRLQSDPSHVLVANNLYDAKYFQHFVGVNLPVVPSLCGYVSGSYSPSRSSFLLAALDGKLGGEFAQMWSTELDAAKVKRGANFSLETISALYNGATRNKNIARHRGVVWLPYDVNPTDFTECYRANVPLFVPSVELLAQWQAHYFIVRKRTLVGRGDRRPGGSFQRPHEDSAGRPDPNNEYDEAAIRHWLHYADYYTMSDVAKFDSIEQLVDLLSSISDQQLFEVSSRMREFNQKVAAEVLSFWRLNLMQIAKRR